VQHIEADGGLGFRGREDPAGIDTSPKLMVIEAIERGNGHGMLPCCTGSRQDCDADTPSDCRRTGTRHPPKDLNQGCQLINGRDSFAQFEFDPVREMHM
jgi:hypothetical protein